MRKLHVVKSSQVKSSTFDRLPYGCLLFLYRVDLNTCRNSYAARSPERMPSKGRTDETGRTFPHLGREHLVSTHLTRLDLT